MRQKENYFQRFQTEWNPAAIGGRTFYDGHLKATVSNAVSQNVQDATVAKDTTTTIHTLIVKIIVDQAFANCNLPFYFHRDALQILEAGHLPCGWILPWPGGKLAVY